MQLLYPRCCFEIYTIKIFFLKKLLSYKFPVNADAIGPRNTPWELLY